MAINKCLTYVCSTTEDGEPILGTMRGYNKLTQNYCQAGCDFIVLPPTQMARHGQPSCKFPSGLRYFYKIDNKGNVVPNSLFSMQNFPQEPTLNCSTILEVLKFC
jgi:hypothetical protein